MPVALWLPGLVKASYLVAATLFLLGLQRMSTPKTARSGIRWAGIGMLLATTATFFLPGLHNIALISLAIAIGGALAWTSGKKVAITDMPQMVALYNGMGGGSAAAIGAVELLRYSSLPAGDFLPSAGPLHPPSAVVVTLAVLGALIGAVSLSGSVIAWAKLDGRMDRRYTFPAQQAFNLLVAIAAVALGAFVVYAIVQSGIVPVYGYAVPAIIAFFVAALALGVLMTLPIGGADMPVVISLLNAFTGLAAAATGLALDNTAMIVAGMIVGASGSILTNLMANAMNRSIPAIVAGGFGGSGTAIGGGEVGDRTVNRTNAADAAIQMAYADQVVVVPGYGMAVAQAQHAVKDMAKQLEAKGVEVKYAIHPVAGRMPGHMNVLLAEADVPYDQLKEMDDINGEFARTDVVLVIGANDVTNPAARTDPSSPIHGMPILNVDESKRIIVLKRSMSSGFAGIDNPLFYDEKTSMLFGDAKSSVVDVTEELKAL